MGGRPLFHLLAYDIADPSRLRAVARIAEKWGVRIQYSLFLVRLSPASRQQLLAELEQVIHPRQDDIRLYPLPAKPKWEVMGKAIWPEGVWLAGEWPRPRGEAESTEAEHSENQGIDGHEST